MDKKTVIKGKNITTGNRSLKLNIPQMIWSGLSENWLLKELGDMHWEMISKSLGAKSNEIVDSNGERLYASFVRLQWSSNHSLYSFKENDKIKLKGELSLYGNKMFFSEDKVTSGDRTILASLMSVFSSRKAEDNQKLRKGRPLNSGRARLKKLDKLPNLAKDFFDAKTYLFSDARDRDSLNTTIGFYGTQFVLEKEPLFTKRYNVDPYDDINGVGLLYFASYPKINDKCERFYFQGDVVDNEPMGSWVKSGYCIARDIHYYGNANADDELLYMLEDCQLLDDDKVQLTSSLHRIKDEQCIAKIFTVKQLVRPLKLNLKKKEEKSLQNVVSPRQERPSIGKAEPRNGNTPLGTTISITDTSGKQVEYTHWQLNGIVQDFLSKLFEGTDIHIKTDLRQVGIESIVLTELSEYLNVTYHLSTNPSKFFGLYTIDAITSHLLEEHSPEKKDTPKKEIMDSDAALNAMDIAIVGMSFRVPGADTKEAFWNILSENRSVTGTVPQDRRQWPIWKDLNLEDEKIQYGGFVDDIDKFDPRFFGISPEEARFMDPQHRMVLESVYTALEDAGIAPQTMGGSDTGVFIGVSGFDYYSLCRAGDNKEIKAYDTIGSSHSILANRISYLLDVHGPSKAIDTACSSSLVAFHEAVKNLKDKSCGIAIVGGVNTLLNPEQTLSYQRAGMLSADGQCKTFDAAANGYVRSEGVGITILKPLSKAKSDGDHIYGVVKGSAINHGGKTNTLTTPNSKAQEELLLAAYRSSGLRYPRDVGYIEAHGTGTPLGDPIEIEGLKQAFEVYYKEQGLEYPPANYCGIGSVKTNIGHLEAAAGIIGLIKVLLSMQNGKLPGNPHLKTQSKYITLEGSPFYLTKQTMDWEVPEGHQRIAGVSSFGFGGVNAHVVVEEYRAASQEKYESNGPLIILLSAKDKDRLKERASRLVDYLQKNDQVNLESLAFTLQVGREHMEARLALEVNNVVQLISELTNYLHGENSSILEGSTDVTEEGFVGEEDVPLALMERKVKPLMELWVKGAVIDWQLWYAPGKMPKKIPLPTYPFAKERYWVEERNRAPKQAHGIRSKASIEAFILEQIAALVHIDGKELDKDEFISDFGIDSIQINQLTNTINTVYGIGANAIEMQSHLTISEIAEFVHREVEKETSNPQKEVKHHENGHEGRSNQAEDIAIVGLDLEVPGATSLEELQSLLESEEYEVSPFPKDRWDRLPDQYTRDLDNQDFKGKFLSNPLGFDHKLFKLSVRESMLMDPQHRLLLHSVWRSIENAGYTRTAFASKRTSVFVSINGVDYSDIVKYDQKVDEFSGRGTKRYISANRISHFFNLMGVSETIDTACSSFFVGVKKGMDAIRKGECDQAIICGVQVNLLPFTFQEQSAQGILTGKDRTLPFDIDAEGYVRAEGVGSILLKKESLAVQDKDYLYARLKGAGVAHGGRSLHVTSPNIASHRQAFVDALEDSGVDINRLLAIESHGTGMPLGDESEIHAFSEVFLERGRKNTSKCMIGAAKSVLGHLEAASGALALMKSILALKEGKMFGIKGIKEVSPKCNLDAFSISPRDTSFKRGALPHIIGLHSYGIGGVSSFLLLEEADRGQPEVDGEVWKVFVLSATSPHTLHLYAEHVSEYLKNASDRPTFDFDHFLASYQCNREVMPLRLAIVADTLEDLRLRLNCFSTATAATSVYDNIKDTANPIVRTEKDKSTVQDSMARQWVHGDTVDWGIGSLSKYPYPHYPMDKRKAFWISQEKAEERAVIEETNTTTIKETEFLMLDL